MIKMNYNRAVEYFNFHTNKNRSVDQAYNTLISQQTKYGELLTNNYEFQSWTRINLLYGEDKSDELDIEETPDWN